MTISFRLGLPRPECEFGYTVDQLKDILGDRLEEFYDWHEGRTYVECDGTQWFPEFRRNGECCNGIKHGDVYYYSDVRRFLDYHVASPTKHSKDDSDDNNNY